MSAMSPSTLPILSAAVTEAPGPGMSLALMVLFTTSVVAALLLGYFWAFRQHLTPLRRQLKQRLDAQSGTGEPVLLLQDEALRVLQEIRDQAVAHREQVTSEQKQAASVQAAEISAIRKEQRDERAQVRAELKEASSRQAAEAGALRKQQAEEREEDRARAKKFKEQVNSILQQVSGHLREVSQKSAEAARAAGQSTEFQGDVARMIAEQRQQLAKLEKGIQYDLMSLAFAPVFDLYDELQNLKQGATGHPELERLVESLERSLHNSFDALRLEPVRFARGADPNADPDRIPAAVWEPNPQAIEAPEPGLAGLVARQSTTGFRIAAGPADKGEVRVLRRAIVTLYRLPDDDGSPQAVATAGQAPHHVLAEQEPDSATAEREHDPVPAENDPDMTDQADRPATQPTQQA